MTRAASSASERPPLHLILNMTGMTRQIYRLSWLDERPFALFQEE